MTRKAAPPDAPAAELPISKRNRGRPPKIDSEQLLKVAREVFLEQGIRASTVEVAERAGVSEATLFHRFKTKEALFREAMQLSEDDVPALLMKAVDSVSGVELDEALNRLAKELLDIGRVGVPLMMMSWSNPCCGQLEDRTLQKFHSFVKHLSGLFQLEMDAGRLRRMDAEIVARTFIGAIHHYCMSRIMAPDASWILPEGMFVRGLVDLLLRGAQSNDPALGSSPFARRGS
jgi:AcrR family transcriptional regulator